MNESQIDLAHALALGSIGDDDRCAVRDILDSEDATLRTDFIRAVQHTREALTVFASTVATEPPISLRSRVLGAITAGGTTSTPSSHPHNALPRDTGRPRSGHG